eukprot:15351876-Ditylum_brightwellii.AAC.1
MSLCTFIACVNKMNNQLEQFLPRDNRTPQVKLAEDTLMDILENAVSKSWKGEISRQRFDCMAEGQAEFIQFRECLELLDPPKQGRKGGHDATLATGTWQQILRKKRGQEADAPSLTEKQACKKVAKFCLLYGRGGHTTNNCEVLKKQVKGLSKENEKDT